MGVSDEPCPFRGLALGGRLSEDVPVKLAIISACVKAAPHCRIINAALQPLWEGLEIAALIAKVLGKIFSAVVLAFISFFKIFDCGVLVIVVEKYLIRFFFVLVKFGKCFDMLKLFCGR